MVELKEYVMYDPQERLTEAVVGGEVVYRVRAGRAEVPFRPEVVLRAKDRGEKPPREGQLKTLGYLGYEGPLPRTEEGARALIRYLGPYRWATKAGR